LDGFQGSALFDSMTVEENVAFPLKMFTNDNKAVLKERVDFVERVALTDAHNKLPSQISGGMQKRVCSLLSTGLNICFVTNNSGLDPNTAILIDNLIKEITEEYDITTVINTHDMNSVMEIGNVFCSLRMD
jgi:phospholipid/cholesterol/gamma-HCH transport system ATP-binding protein